MYKRNKTRLFTSAVEYFIVVVVLCWVRLSSVSLARDSHIFVGRYMGELQSSRTAMPSCIYIHQSKYTSIRVEYIFVRIFIMCMNIEVWMCALLCVVNCKKVNVLSSFYFFYIWVVGAANSKTQQREYCSTISFGSGLCDIIEKNTF